MTTKLSRDGSATIRRAKLMLAKTELKQWFKEFLNEPNDFTLTAFNNAISEYYKLFPPVNQPVEPVQPVDGSGFPGQKTSIFESIHLTYSLRIFSQRSGQ